MLNLTKTNHYNMTNPPQGLIAAPQINNLKQEELINPVEAAKLAEGHKKVLLGRFPTLATQQIKLLLPEGCEAVYMEYNI